MKNTSFSRRFAAVLACACLLVTLSLSGIFAAELDQAEYAAQSRTFTSMEILFDSSLLVFIPEFPDAEYSAGVRVNYSDTSEDIPDSSAVQWSSDNHDIFWVNTNGAIHPTGVGSANITAEYSGHSVTQALTINAGSIVAIEPQFDEFMMPTSKSTYVDIPVYARASNGILFEITDPDEINWSAKNARVAKNDDGSVLLSNNGDATLTVSAYGKAESVSVFALDKSDITLTASSAEKSLNPNQASSLFISATSGGHTFDVTTSAQWSVSDESVVQAIDGYVFAGELGEATITISYEGQTLTVPVEVVPAPPNYDPPAFG